MTDKPLNALFDQVRLFHTTFSAPAPDSPVMQTVDQVQRRIAWIESECRELDAAETIVDQADAYMDIIYFGIGGLVELGVVPQELWDAVQEANMAKLWPDGKARIREHDGKIMKPPLWQGPEPVMSLAVHRQIMERPMAET